MKTSTKVVLGVGGLAVAWWALLNFTNVLDNTPLNPLRNAFQPLPSPTLRGTPMLASWGRY